MALAASPAIAQTDSPPAQAASAQANAPADEIVVTGLRASLRDALQAKRAASVVTETISSKDIGVLPDVTIADQIARLPGVTATRDRGNASQAAVRGLGPRLVLGLVNGREVASSEPDRNVRWEIYPSEIVSGATLYKSQSADLIAGGVAGTIDIRTVRPLDYSGPALTLRAGALYNDGGKSIPHYSPWGARGSGQLVEKLTDTLAVSLGGTYQRQRNGFESFQGWGYNTPDTGTPPTLNGKPVNAPWGAQTEIKALTETRWSSTLGVQWKPSDRWDVNADLLYSNVKINERQYQQWYGRSNGWGDWGGTIGAPGDIYQSGSYTLTGNDITAAKLNNFSSVTNVLAKYTEDKTLFVSGLNARYHGDDWTATFDASYSEARRNNLWRSVATESYPASTSFSTGAGTVPSVTVSSNPADVTAQTVQSSYPGVYDGPQRLADSLGAAQADFRYDLHGGFFSGIGAGMRYSNRVKSFTAGTATVATKTGSGFTVPSNLLESFQVGSFSVPNMLYGDYDAIAPLALAAANPANDPTRGWRVREDDFEGYVKADFESTIGNVPLNGNIGVRFVDVTTHSNAVRATTSWNGTANVTVNSPVDANAEYFRALPSLNLNFDLTRQLKLRAGVARVMSRPPLDELRGNQLLSFYPPQLTGSAGNPYLRPFMASQGDLSLEWYFRKDALFALAGYYKKVDTNIGYTQTQQVVNGQTYTITGPANGNGGDIYGAEATFQTPFWFVPALEHFGVYSNLALVGSNVHELAPASNPFKAVGLAKFTGEFDIYYSDKTFDIRVAVKHHTPFTVIYGWDASQLTRLESETILGASISANVTKNVSVRFQANNLTNQAARFYWNNDPQQLARYERYGRSFLADVTFKY
ncbi:TonB-dependent receptor [Sphingomonas sp. 22176]|uniref:TonB-dependent receptor n=1 Tax=Sphingomonas sp. 22176 TaxID=3453884 RepID=UPI003F84785A